MPFVWEYGVVCWVETRSSHSAEAPVFHLGFFYYCFELEQKYKYLTQEHREKRKEEKKEIFMPNSNLPKYILKHAALIYCVFCLEMLTNSLIEMILMHNVADLWEEGSSSGQDTLGRQPASLPGSLPSQAASPPASLPAPHKF